MKIKRSLITLTIGLGVMLTLGLFISIGRAAPGNPVLDPPRNSHTAPLTTTISITYDEPISAATVTSRTFAVHGMQSGLATATHAVRGGTIIVTPTRLFHQGELVYVVATTHTLNITGTAPPYPIQWQFNAGKVATRCVGSFTDIGVGLPSLNSGSLAWGDYDNDGDLDILLTGNGSRVYRNDAGSFTDIGAGLTGVTGSSAAWGDYDNDGDLDILFAGWRSGGPVSRVYRNDAGSFTDIGAGLPGVASGSVAWGDYDNDGDLDILLTGDTIGNYVSQIYRNDAGDFTDIGAGLPGVGYSSAAWGDYDNDGDLDILLTGWIDNGGIYIGVSRVYRNDEGNFTNAGVGLPGIDHSSVAWGDYDSDGDLDILLAGNKISDHVAQIYRNDGGNFTNINTGLEGVSHSSVAWGDYDNDGDLDILLVGYQSGNPKSFIYRNDDGDFADIGAGLAGSNVATWGDYDNDGDLDILLQAWSNSLIYRNDDCPPDLALVKAAAPQVVAPGDAITYTLTFLNAADAGAPTATGVVITDTLPVSVMVGSIISSGVAITDTGASPSCVWQVQDLSPGKGGVITITGRVSSTLRGSSIFVNTATITGTTVDADITNNISTAGTFVDTALLHPPRNSHTAPLATTISITYDKPISAATVTSHTFAVHAMQSGLLTATHNVSGNTIIVTPTQLFHQGERVYAIATAGLLDITGTKSFSSVQWQFSAGQVAPRCVAGFTAIGTGLPGGEDGSIAWGDYDSDNDLDILFTGHIGSGNYVSRVYRNDGGSFTDIEAGLVGVWSGSVAWGDYDNDGDLDILLTGETSGGDRVSRVYRNDTGSFTDIGATSLTGVDQSSAVWGDYDNDGDLDILLTGNSDGGRVSQVYRNDNGSFTNINAGLIGVAFSSVAWGDYDNDGDLDILLAGNAGSGNQVSRVYRNTNGSFTDIGAGLIGVYHSSVAWGDYDNDGDLDVLLTGYTGSSRVSRVYRNDASSFTNIGADLEGVAYSSAAWGDYDNDGDLDILLVGAGAESRVYRNNGPISGWTFTDINAGLPTIAWSGVAAWGDYDNDDDLDILLTQSGSVSQIYRNDDCFADLAIVKAVTPQVAAPGDIVTYTLTFFNASDTDGFTAAGVVITDSMPVSVTVVGIISSGVAITDTVSGPFYVWNVADLPPGEGGVITITGQISSAVNGGSIIANMATITGTTVDIATANNVSTIGILVDAVRLHPRRNSHTAPPTTNVSISYSGSISPTTVSTRTFAVHAMQTGLLTQTYSVYSGTISLMPARPFKPGELVQVSATTGTLGLEGGTLSLDGISPLSPTVWQFRVATYGGTGLFASTFQTRIIPITTTIAVELGDVDGDGDVDAFVVSNNGANEVWLNDGKGSFSDSGQRLGSAGSGDAALGDLDGDGDLDAFVANVWPQPNTVWLNDGIGTFINSGQDLGSLYSWSVALGDVDGDGDLDAFVANGDWPGEPNKVWLNDGTGTFDDSGQSLGNTVSEDVELGDVDSDGDLDAFIANAQDGQANEVWLNNGTGIFIDSGQSLGASYSWDAALGDLDNDGDLDAFVANGFLDQPDRVWLNDGIGTFNDSGQNLGDSYSNGVALGDFDGDGDLDAFIVTSFDQGNKVWLNDGTGFFDDSEQDLGNALCLQVVLEDADSDGDLDAFVASDDVQAEMLWLNQNQVNLPMLGVHKLVDISGQESVSMGGIVTYTIVISNDGDGVASGVVMTDDLPDGISFGGWVQQGSAIPPLPTDVITWGPRDVLAGAGYEISFRGLVTTSLAFAGKTITNTVTFSSTDAGSGFNDAVFTIADSRRVYLPLVVRN